MTTSKHDIDIEHAHVHHEGCECDHDHIDEHCDCGHEHHHEHNQEHEHHHEHCDCGHDHHHEHSHEHEHHHEHCNCGHEHYHKHSHEHEHHHHEHVHHHNLHDDLCNVCGQPLDNCTCTLPNANDIKRIYILENLGCANCAAKMEKKIRELPGITSATLTFATKQLRVTGENPDALITEMQNICSSIESEVKVIPRNTQQKSVKHEKSETSDSKTNNKKASKISFLSSEHSRDLIAIIIGALLFITGEILEHQGMKLPSLIILLIAYLILGGEIVITAVKNLFKGNFSDENFLMSIATIGAFAIHEYPEAVGVMLFFRIGEYFEHVAVEKSRSQIMAAVDMRPEVVNLVTDNDIIVIDASSAKVGDILLIRPGDRIPLDGIVVEGESRIDTSPITGEPVPVKAVAGDNITSGCVNTSGLLKMQVEKILEDSMVTRILDSVENAAASKPKIDRFITRFARIYTPFVIILALVTAIIPSIVTGNWNYWVYTALSFLVMSCPCALVLSVPLAFFSGIGAGSKRGILFKGGVSLEAMKYVDAVVMDKTGTITKGNFVVQNTVPANSSTSEKELLSLAASCELTSTHPIGNSIVTAAKGQNIEIVPPSSVEEVAGYGIRVIVNDMEILCGNRQLMEKHNISLDGYQQINFGTEVLIAKNGNFLGHLVISDTIKDDAKTAVEQIKKLGISTIMLTGDAEDSASAVAKATGIEEVHAKLLPQDKLSSLDKIRHSHRSVMFVGDGINDAPVLAGADVGAAMGSGADAAIEAADVVFMTSNMEAIPQALSIAKSTNDIAMQNVVFALVVKGLAMILGLCGFASMWTAVFADTGVAMICILNSIRVLYKK